jgi:3-oxoacid CoA-transferase A subunit
LTVNKIVGTFEAAVADIFDGAVILIGGFGPADGNPSYLITALRDQGAKNLTLVMNNIGYGENANKFWANVAKRRIPPGYADAGILVENGQVKKAITSFPIAPNPMVRTPFQEKVEAGHAEVELATMGTLAERIRAGRAGVLAFYVPVGLGTIVQKGKEVRVISGVKCILEYAIKADFALIKAHKADRFGNLVYRGTSRNFNGVMAGAATVTIVEANEIVEAGELPPEGIATPGIYVNRIVQRPGTTERSK